MVSMDLWTPILRRSETGVDYDDLVPQNNPSPLLIHVKIKWLKYDTCFMRHNCTCMMVGPLSFLFDYIYFMYCCHLLKLKLKSS